MIRENDFLKNLVIQVDSREQLPYSFPGHRTVTEKLDVGDYSLLHCPEIAIERKSLDDLIGSLTSGRERFEAEMKRGSQLYYFALVIEASLSDLANGQYRSQALPKSIVQTLLSWSMKYRVHVLFCDSRGYAEKVTLSLLLKYARMFYQKYAILSKSNCKTIRDSEELNPKLTKENPAVKGR